MHAAYRVIHATNVGSLFGGKSLVNRLVPAMFGPVWSVRSALSCRRKGYSMSPRGVPATKTEVPVRRLAEYVSASFTAASDKDVALNAEGTKWYHTDEGDLTLFIPSGVIEGAREDVVLTFDIDHLAALCGASKTMDTMDIDELIGL